jgi:hypothetical protein
MTLPGLCGGCRHADGNDRGSDGGLPSPIR